jgi:hypothetical protein
MRFQPSALAGSPSLSRAMSAGLELDKDRRRCCREVGRIRRQWPRFAALNAPFESVLGPTETRCRRPEPLGRVVTVEEGGARKEEGAPQWCHATEKRPERNSKGSVFDGTTRATGGGMKQRVGVERKVQL